MNNLLTKGINAKVVIPTEMSRNLTIDNITKAYQVYKVRLDWLYYNDQNDRIATWISQYKADNNKDEIGIDDREIYNSIIHEFITSSNPSALDKTQNNIEMVGQREPGVVLGDGRIIDGNRRFTCLRNLAQNNGQFSYFESVILDYDIKNNEKEIKLLELMIQHGTDKPVDYNPIDRLVGIYNDIIDRELITVLEYSKSVNQSVSEIQREVEKAKLMVDFLEFIDAPKQFHIARNMDLNGPLQELYAILKKCPSDDKREDVKNSAFANFLMQPQGDMTRYIRKIKKVVDSKYLDSYLDEQLDSTEKILEMLNKQGKITEKVINEKIRANDEVKECLEKSLEKAVRKADAANTRNKPAQQLDKILQLIEEIDVNIFKKLDSNQMCEINLKLDAIEAITLEVRNATNV